MVRVLMVFAASVLALAMLGEQTTAESPPTLKADVRKALDQLNAASLAERQQAEQRLIELGPAVLPLLPPMELVNAVSAKQALKRVRVRLEEDAARQSIAPSKLTLKGTYSLAELSAEIDKQTRNRVLVPMASATNSVKPLTLDWSSRSFWDAITDLEQQQLTIEFSGQRAGYEWKSLAAPRRSVSQLLGGFRVEADPIELRATTNADQQLWLAHVTISAEPRLRPLLLRYSAADFALGDDGTIKPFDPEARIEVPLGDGGRVSQFSLTFAGSSKPAANAESSATTSLRGTARLVVAAGEEPIEFKDFGRAQGVSRRHGGVTVALTSVRMKREANGKLAVSARLQVSYDSPQHAFESHQLWVFHNHVFLKSPTGQQVPHTGGAETLFQNEGVVGVEYRFADLPDDARLWSLNYVAPTLLIEVPLEFRLADVPVLAKKAEK